MCACPGARWIRHDGLDPEVTVREDVADIVRAGAEGLISLMEEVELRRLELDALPVAVREAGLWWIHLPIRDMQPPGAPFERGWREHGALVRERLRAGGHVVLHCFAGLGRTGTVAARLLVELGMPPRAAITAVRTVRPGAIQTFRQALHVRLCRSVRS